MPEWTEVGLVSPLSEGVARGKGVEPVFKLMAEFDTTVEMEAFTEYLFHPFQVLARAGGRLGELGIDDEWKMQTVIWNHHRGLNPRINMCTITVSAEEKTIYQDIYKQHG